MTYIIKNTPKEAEKILKKVDSIYGRQHIVPKWHFSDNALVVQEPTVHYEELMLEFGIRYKYKY